jgi:chromosome segregation ATPase
MGRHLLLLPPSRWQVATALSDLNTYRAAFSPRSAQRAEDRAAELRVKIEALQVQLVTAEAEGNALTVETAELTTQLSQARRVAQEAQESAEELRRAEQARAGKGGLARLRAVWRGQL